MPNTPPSMGQNLVVAPFHSSKVPKTVPLASSGGRAVKNNAKDNGRRSTHEATTTNNKTTPSGGGKKDRIVLITCIISVLLQTAILYLNAWSASTTRGGTIGSSSNSLSAGALYDPISFLLHSSSSSSSDSWSAAHPRRLVNDGRTNTATSTLLPKTMNGGVSLQEGQGATAPTILEATKAEVRQTTNREEEKEGSRLPVFSPSSYLTDFGAEQRQPQQPRHSGRLRVLFGILTADFPNDRTYRRRHRDLFALWNDDRVCSLDDFKTRPPDERHDCQLVYTFVVGANPAAPPELVDDSRPMLVPRPVPGTKAADVNFPDVTLLNIRENMNEGKSQTWLKYGAEVAETYDLDYVAKSDADSLLHLHEFFQFAYRHLPPAPYNRHVYAGALRDKAYWPRHATEDERVRYESYFGNNYEGVHLYVAGQMYILSADLARFVAQEAAANKCSYCEGHEDHDVSAMAFHSPQPVKLVVIGRSHRFWEHPVKGEPRWKRIWKRETARMMGVPFEGKMFSTNSTIEAVLKSG